MVKVLRDHLRRRLEVYYQTDGREDDIVIEPRSGLIPDIKANSGFYRGLSSDAAMYCLDAFTALEKRDASGYKTAFEFLEAALAEHPEHPIPLSLMAQVHISRAMYSRYAPTELAQAKRLISALHDKKSRPWQYWLAYACLTATLEFDWKTAQKFFNTAISQYELAKYHPWHTAFLASEGNVGLALGLRKEAVSQGPRPTSAITRGDLAMMMVIAGDYEDAEKVINNTIRLMANHHYLPYLHRALLFEAQDKFEDAVKAIDQVPTQSPESFITMGLRYTMYGLNGDTQRAQEGFADLRTRKSSANQALYVPASQVAMAALGAGYHDEAVRWIMQAVIAEHDPILMWLNVLPHLRHLYDNHAFQQVLKLINRKPLARPKPYNLLTPG